MPHPVVDLPDTRALEHRGVIRPILTHATVLEVDTAHVVLATRSFATGRLTNARATDDQRFGGAPSLGPLPDEGTELPGTLRLDLLAGGAFRVRYCEGDRVPVNATPMVVGSLAPQSVDTPPDVTEHHVRWKLSGRTLTIALRPLVITVTDDQGLVVCQIGGKDTNGYACWDSFNTAICRTAPDGHPLAVEKFALRPDEAAYGFGEQFLGINKVGQTIDLNMMDALGVVAPRSYKNIPFFVTTRGYGVYFNHSSRLTAWVGSMSATEIQVAIEDPFLDYVVFLGDIKTVLSRYTDITGKPAVPPAWSFGFWQSKISYQSAAEAIDVVRRLRAADLPVDVIHLDTFWFTRDWFCDLEFDAQRFPDPAAFFAELAGLGVHVSLWQLPYIPEPSGLFDELLAVDGFVKTDRGELYDVGICYTPGWDGGRVGAIDFTNPAAVTVYQRHVRRLLELGARAIKVDFGEQAPLDGVYHDGTPGHQAHNLYPLLYNQAVADVTQEATGESIIWARSAWAGSQRYPLHWGGDATGNWANLAPQIAGGLSLGLSGFPFWSQDIGGFLGHPDDELLIRWWQASMFLSHTRIHGFGARELDRFEKSTLEICRQFLHLRYQLLPYLLATAHDAAARSLPVARPLVVEFQDDPTTRNIADQWMLGDALLVAPVLEPARARMAYLPPGTWADWWTGESIEGGRWIRAEAPLERIPLWLREGHFVPLGPTQLHVGERPTTELTVRVAPPPPDTAGQSSTMLVEVDGGSVRLVLDHAGGSPVLRVTGTAAAAVKIEVEVLGSGAVNLVGGPDVAP